MTTFREIDGDAVSVEDRTDNGRGDGTELRRDPSEASDRTPAYEAAPVQAAVASTRRRTACHQTADE